VRRFYNEDNGFSILLPTGWHRQSGFPNTVVLVVAPERGAKFRTSINVTVADLSLEIGAPRKATLQEFYQINKNKLMEILPGEKYDVQESMIVVQKLPGILLSFSNKVEKVDMDVRFVVGVWKKDDMVYVVTCSTETSKARRYMPLFRRVLYSLQIK